MDVAGVHLQGVVEGGVDQFDHPALVFADTGQRQALHGVQLGDRLAVVIQRVDGMEAFFVAGQKAGQLGRLHQVQRRALQAFVDPGKTGGVEGVGEHAQRLAVVFQEDEFAFQALGQADAVEQRGGGEQRLAVQYRVMQGGAEGGDKVGRGQTAQALQGVDQAFGTLLSGGSGLSQ
ncbi:hypothetical protein D3C77_551890 [compost metagenome]